MDSYKRIVKAYSSRLLLAVMLLHVWHVQAATLPVLPYPQRVATGQESVHFPARLHIQGIGTDKAMMARLGTHWQKFSAEMKAVQPAAIRFILLGKNGNADALVRQLAGAALDSIGQEGYVLVVNSRQRFVAALSETGLFYGLQTLKQLTRAGWNKAITITDWPAYARRVIFDDISRGPISTVTHIKQQIERMAELKINYLSFYIEHVVQPLSHPDFAPANGKLTIAQIRELSAYAATYHMQLIGSFQSFGHFEKILSLPQYRSMGETNSLISPLDPRAKQFLTDVIGELCDAFSAPWFNVNCDETFSMDKGRSKAYVDSVGIARFYADHLWFLYDVVKRKGKRLMMWGDIALQHEEVLDLLPKDVIYLTWEYGDQTDYDRWIQPFVKRGLEYMVCAGILNSYRMFPDMAMAKANIEGFYAQGKRDGATGAFATIWDDGGTYLFAADWYGVYVAAEKSWNVNGDHTPSFDERYMLCAYGDAGLHYADAIFTLMKLRALPLTYNLNDQLWHQKILPDSGKQLILNNVSAPEALQLVNAAGRLAATGKARRNEEDIAALQYSIEQYRLMITTRLTIAGVVKQYATAASMAATDPRQGAALVKACADTLRGLREGYHAAATWFRQAWLKANQPYWLDNALTPYKSKMNDLAQLETTLRRAAAALPDRRALPAAAGIRLDIMETTRNYFRNWMLGGPFPVKDYGRIPVFLYADEQEYNVPPFPGGLTRYQGKTFRWQKFSSPDGGIVDLDAHYRYKGAAAAYAYCQLSVDSPLTVTAFLAAGDSVALYCNGVHYTTNPVKTGQERAIQLRLNKGVNRLLIKSCNEPGRPWKFTFRLQEDIAITNHKHKYQLNAKSTVYEAD